MYTLLSLRWPHALLHGLTIAVVLLGAAQARAADTPPRLNLDQLLQQVRERNLQLRADQAAASSLQFRAEQAGALDDPRLHYAVAPASLGLRDSDPGHIVGFSQTLPWPGKRKAQREQADHLALAGQQRVATRWRELALQTRLSFANWYLAHRRRDDNLQHQQHLRTLVAASEQAYASAQSGQQAVLAARLSLLELRQAQLKLDAEIQTLQADLNTLRQRPANTPLGAAGELPLRMQALPEINAALQDHPSLRQAQARVAAAAAKLRLVRLDRRPDLQLNLQYLGTLPRDEYRSQIGVALNLPLAQGKRSAAIHAAEAELASEQAALQALHDELARALSHAHASWQQARASLPLYRDELIPLAQQNFQVALAAFSSGDGDIDAVINAQHAWLETRTALHQQHTDAFRALARINWLNGEIPTAPEAP